MSEVVAELPPIAYTLQLSADPEGPERGLVVALSPKNPRSAAMRVHTVEGDRNAIIFLGADSTLELFARSRHAGLEASSLIEECALIAAAVVAGRFQEALLLQGDDILESRGVIDTSKASIETSRHSFGSRLLQRTRRESRAYEPYADAALEGKREG